MLKTKEGKRFNKVGIGASALFVMTGVVTPVAFANEGERLSLDVNDGIGINSNNDVERRTALGTKYGILLTDSMVWEDKKGKVAHTTENGEDVFYTSHDEMKAQGFYVVNANRQELIQYGIQTGDWQPYRAYEAERTPAYFEIVDGKYEYNKVYYGQMIRVINSNYTYNLGKQSTEEERAVFKADYERDLQDYIVKFRNAPGIVPYVVGLNNTSEIANKYGVSEPADGFYNSKYNHPTVLSEGKFKEDAPSTNEDLEEVSISTTLSRNNENSEVILQNYGTIGINEEVEVSVQGFEVESSAEEVITVLEDNTAFITKEEVSIDSVNENEETIISNEVSPPTEEELAALTGLKSNDDSVRRKAIEEEFGIELTDDIDWEDKEGQVAGVDENGEETYYTPHSEMKKLGFYAVNANRQELIQYAIKTGDWYPYRALEAKTSPAYFELIEDKYEYNKVYYGHLIESSIMTYRFDMMGNLSDEEKENLTNEHNRFLKEYIQKFNEAPGIVPYVIGLNNTSEIAEENSVEEPFDGYFDSKWNYPTVMSEGKFKPEIETE